MNGNYELLFVHVRIFSINVGIYGVDNRIPGFFCREGFIGAVFLYFRGFGRVFLGRLFLGSSFMFVIPHGLSYCLFAGI